MRFSTLFFSTVGHGVWVFCFTIYEASVSTAYHMGQCTKIWEGVGVVYETPHIIVAILCTIYNLKFLIAIST